MYYCAMAEQSPGKHAIDRGFGFAEIAREASPTARACVVRILSIWCGGPVEQEALSASGACAAVAAMLHNGRGAPPPARALPALDLLAAMCFENASVSQVAMNTR